MIFRAELAVADQPNSRQTNLAPSSPARAYTQGEQQIRHFRSLVHLSYGFRGQNRAENEKVDSVRLYSAPSCCDRPFA